MPSSKYWRIKTIKKEERVKRRKVIFFWFSFMVAFLTIMWSFFMSPFFKITEIKLPENDFITNDEIHKLMVSSAPLNLGENIFILSTNRIKSDLAATFPNITDINVKKELFHGLIINFEKRIQIGIWCQPKADPPLADNCYYFDKEGIVFKKAPISEGSLILKITDFKKKSVLIGDKILNNNSLKFILSFNETVEQVGRFKITEFKIKPVSNISLEAVVDSKWSIYLDSAQNSEIEAANLFTVVNEALKNKLDNLVYIDLRIPSRISYCDKREICGTIDSKNQ